VRRLPSICTALLLVACDPAGETTPPPPSGSDGHEAPAADPVTAEFLKQHVRTLSADDMQGRRPGTEGGKKAVAYIIAQMEAIGLEPAGENGGWTQTVPMRSIKTDQAKSKLTLFRKRKKLSEWSFAKDWVGTTFADGTDHAIDAELVFLGYGVTAPEYQWDDYEGVDLKGKVVVVFVGDPPVEDGRFGGPAMTYYGRWSYKYERALEAGAIGCLVIHETEPASYGWNVPTSSYSGERFHVVAADGQVPPNLALQGWISTDQAKALAKQFGSSLEAWHAAALDPTFKAQRKKLFLRGNVSTTERRTKDVNVLGQLRGGDRADEAVIVTAHWDHLGMKADPAEGDDAIYNGAVDNASGTAGLLAVGAGLKARFADKPLARSVVLFATTAEEQGLLGARYYAANPLVPLAKIAGVVNMDSINVYGKTKSVEVIGSGQSTMEDVLAGVIETEGRTILPESRPGAGGFYRSDHFPFAKVGVPALYFHAALETLEEGDVDATMKTRRANYHTVSDEYDEGWSFAGAVQHVHTIMEVVARVADEETPPAWKPTSEFAKIER
jgi:Zn-dependent M28 family amino/carboxypeptidase